MRIRIINPEQEIIYSQKNFALQLLWRYSDFNKPQKMPLYKIMDEKKLLDKTWIFTNDYKIILDSKIIKTYNYPLANVIKELPKEKWIRFWEQKKDLPSADLLVIVADKKFLQHLSVGDKWLTRAIDYDFT